MYNTSTNTTHGVFHANQTGHNMHPNANPIYQRQDFQNRRSASEPAHELQANRSTNTVSSSSNEHATNNRNHSNEPNHQHGDDCNFVDCLQKITTVKVR